MWPSSERKEIRQLALRFALLVPAALLLALLACEVTMRVAFPWDLYFWPESPFLTNMMKLTAGRPIYTSAGELNSFIYSPGLEYLAYAVLRPFHLQLDIRACRCVSVFVVLLAAAVGARTSSQVIAARSRSYEFLAFAVSTLILFKGDTADVCHPDNLHILHATITFALCTFAVLRNRFSLALLAIAWAGTGVLAKQTAVFGLVGAFAAIAVACGREFGWRRLLLLFAVGALTASLSFALLLGSGDARFYMIRILSSEPIYWSLAARLVTDALRPFRLALVVMAPICLAYLLRSRNGTARRYVLTWVLVGGAAVLPSLAAYLKIGGAQGNLRGIEFWLTLVITPVLWTLVFSEERRGIRWAAISATVGLVIVGFPIRVPPSARRYAYGNELNEHIRLSVWYGKQHILLAHGSMPLIQASLTQPPLDRAVSALELQWGGYYDFSSMEERIRSKYYDRIYLNWAAYGPKILALIDENYHQIAIIPGYDAPSRGNPVEFYDYNFGLWEGAPYGYQGGLMGNVAVMDPKP